MLYIECVFAGGGLASLCHRPKENINRRER